MGSPHRKRGSQISDTFIAFQLLVATLLLLCASSAMGQVRKIVFDLEIPPPADSRGGIVASDVNGDGRIDLLVSVPGHIAAYTVDGTKLWVKQTDLQVTAQSEVNGLPGHHGPGLAVGDVDGDGRPEVVYLTREGTLHVLEGATGRVKASADPPVPDGAARWEMAFIADFRGEGDRDILLQATNKDGYRMGRYLAAYRYADLIAERSPMWTTDRFVSCAHNGARLADLNGDGRDEILGATIFGPDGALLAEAIEGRYHMDSVFAAKVRPDLPGLQVVLLEEGENHVQLLGVSGPIWRVHHDRQEPQNAAVGRFEPGGDAMFVWCRSRYDKHQKPFVFDAHGRMVFSYAMDRVAPQGWTLSGVEVIHTIDWTGEAHQLAAAKERHTAGDVGIFEPLTGRFVEHFKQKADRLYIADVTGDWREEVIVLSGGTVTIYENAAPNPNPDRPRRWTDRNYPRLKQYHNYYLP